MSDISETEAEKELRRTLKTYEKHGAKIYKYCDPQKNNTPDYYVPLRDLGSIENQKTVGLEIVKAVNAVEAVSHVGSYPITSNEMAVIISNGADILEDMGLVNPTFARQLAEQRTQAQEGRIAG